MTRYHVVDRASGLKSRQVPPRNKIVHENRLEFSKFEEVEAIESTIMTMHRAVRAAALTEASIGSLRGCRPRSRFLCLNAPSRAGTIGEASVKRGNGTQRYFSETRTIRAGAAEAV